MKKFKHKYHAKITECDGIKFHSKKEAVYYQKLKMLQKNDQIVFFLRQVPFDLPGNVKYRCDFMVFYTNGDISFIDVKGMKTTDYIIKKKQVEAIYPIKIEEV